MNKRCNSKDFAYGLRIVVREWWKDFLIGLKKGDPFMVIFSWYFVLAFITAPIAFATSEWQTWFELWLLGGAALGGVLILLYGIAVCSCGFISEICERGQAERQLKEGKNE